MHAQGRLCAHLLNAQASDHETVLVSEDLSKAFDTISIDMALYVLYKLGMPVNLVKIIRYFYKNCKRVLCNRGYYSNWWMGARNGILQGCPWSVLLLSGVQFVWFLYVRDSAGRVLISVFFDDRVYYSSTEDNVEAVESTFQKSRTIDNALGLTANNDKFQIGCSSNSCLARTNKTFRRHNLPKAKRTIKMLGVIHNLGTRATPVERLQLQEVYAKDFSNSALLSQ